MLLVQEPEQARTTPDVDFVKVPVKTLKILLSNHKKSLISLTQKHIFC